MMDQFNNPYMSLPGITPEEIGFLKQATSTLSENQQKYSYMVYSGKRKNSQDLMIFTIIGFFGIAGIQRIVVGQTLMGLLYFFTVGFCFIGTIVDLVNSQSLATEYNKKSAYESYQIAKMGAA